MVSNAYARTTIITMGSLLRGKKYNHAKNYEIFKTLLIFKDKSWNFFENPFSRSIRNTMHKKGLKFAPVVELVK